MSRTTFLMLILAALLTSCAGSGGGYRYEDPTASYWHVATNGAGMPRRKPGGQVVTVEAGETLYSIARAHSVDVRSIIDANGLVEPYNLWIGQQLTIPANRFHTVEKQETIYSISKAYDVDMASLALLNNIDPPYTISIGQRLIIPATSAGTVGWETDFAGVAMGVPDRSNAPTSQEPPRTGYDDPYGKAPPEGRFLRPVAGRLISSFGKKEGGLHNDGINVSAAQGAPVFAADDGVVTYTGNELRGYGNLILVRHSDNWVTAYAHIHRFRVARGDRITRGQHIADVGQTGNVASPQLHFELRDGTRPVNPVMHLSPR